MVPAALNPPRGPATAGGTVVSPSLPPPNPCPAPDRQGQEEPAPPSPPGSGRQLLRGRAGAASQECVPQMGPGGARATSPCWPDSLLVPVFTPCTHPWVLDACVLGFSACAGGRRGCSRLAFPALVLPPSPRCARYPPRDGHQINQALFILMLGLGV